MTALLHMFPSCPNYLFGPARQIEAPPCRLSNIPLPESFPFASVCLLGWYVTSITSCCDGASERRCAYDAVSLAMTFLFLWVNKNGIVGCVFEEKVVLCV